MSDLARAVLACFRSTTTGAADDNVVDAINRLADAGFAVAAALAEQTAGRPAPAARPSKRPLGDRSDPQAVAPGWADRDVQDRAHASLEREVDEYGLRDWLARFLASQGYDGQWLAANQYRHVRAAFDREKRRRARQAEQADQAAYERQAG
jgi:hypothetical protein